MIKVRLEGTKEELEDFLAGFRPGYKILNESAPYANRGASKYVRIYLDVEQYSIDQLSKKCAEMMKNL